MKVYTNECLIENCEFAESKNASAGNSGSGNVGSQSNSVGDGFMNIPDGIDEELPFN